MITDIQRFSLNDGPGIRTTVFFKGCPLHCVWCHNPEAIRFEKELMLYPEKCIGCGNCARVCSSGARHIEDGKLYYEAEKCVSGMECANECFSGAIEVSGMEMSAQAIADEVMKDADYYRRSGGGVTLSGGEVLAQSKFAKELLQILKSYGVSTAIETSLFAGWETVQEVLENVDLVMADLKVADSAAHKRYVGVPNEGIVENLKHLGETGTPLILRTPVIPGINDSTENIRAVAKVASTLKNLRYYELLNYNPLGESKYSALCRGYKLHGAKPLSAAAMENLRKAAMDEGLHEVRVG